MKVEIDIYGAGELRALAVFANSLADARTADEAAKRDMIDKLPGLAGLVGRAEGVLWSNHTGSGENPVDVAAGRGTTEVGQTEVEANLAAQTKSTRERGKPSPGHARRTKEEIAEDKAADEANAALKTAGEETGAVVPDKQVDERPLISTDPENRVGPEDTPEDQAQDAADEAAETAAAKAETGNKPTLDDIRTVLGNYQKVYGLPATMEDGPIVIGEVVAGAKKVSDVPEDKIADVVAALKAAGKTNRFQRAVVQS